MHTRRTRIAMAIAGLCGLSWPAAAVAQIVALGASNTAGYGVGVDLAFPAQLEAMLRAQGRPMRVANAGVSGDTSAGMLARLDKVVPAGTRIVIVQFGVNDERLGVSPEQRRANIARMESQLQARGARMIAVDALIASTVRGGMQQGDDVHLSAEGHRAVAAALVDAVRDAER